jgi:hypothetical protein
MGGDEGLVALLVPQSGRPGVKRNSNFAITEYYRAKKRQIDLFHIAKRGRKRWKCGKPGDDVW